MGAELEGEIPSYAEHDNFLVKVPALKELLRRGGFPHRCPLALQGQLFKFAPEPRKETFVPESAEFQPFDLRALRHSYNAEDNSPSRPFNRKKSFVAHA